MYTIGDNETNNAFVYFSVTAVFSIPQLVYYICNIYEQNSSSKMELIKAYSKIIF